jgi:cytochrome c oxidase subunit III
MVENMTERNKIHPLKFQLYIGMVGIVMFFTALTSAYIVRQAAGNWLEFRLPNMFFTSTAVIILSSLTLHLSYKSFLGGNENRYRLFLVASFILSFAFIICQYLGWQQMGVMGVDLKGNPAGSFVYALSIAHVLHVLGGIAAITMACLHAFLLKFKVTPRRKLRFELTMQYWHFVDIIWVYLFIFMLLQR